MTKEIKTTENFGVIADAKPIERKDRERYLPALANTFMDLTMDNLIYLNNPEKLPSKYERNINENYVITVYSNKEQTIIIKRPNILNISGNNKKNKNEKKTYLKLLAYIFSKAKEIKDKHNITELNNPSIKFLKQELVDIGIYKNTETVTKAIKKYSDLFLKLSVNVIKQGNTYTVSQNDIEFTSIIFTTIGQKLSEIFVSLNPVIWNNIDFYFTTIPNWAFRLSDRAFNLVYFISEQLRRNAKILDEQGYYRLSIKAICEKLNIPKKEECANPTKQIKNEIIKIVEEINKHQDYPDLTLKIELDTEKGLIIDKFLKGYLKITPHEYYKTFFMEVRNAQIEQREKAKQLNYKKRVSG